MFFERFSQHARHVVLLAQQEARALGHDYLGTEHLLLGLLTEHAGLAARILSDLGINPQAIRKEVTEIIGRGPPTRPDPEALRSIGIDLDAVRSKVEEAFGPGALDRMFARREPGLMGRRTCRKRVPAGFVPFTPRAKKALELSLRAARQLGHDRIGTEHILLGLLAEGEGMAAELLGRSGVDVTRARTSIIDALGPSADAG